MVNCAVKSSKAYLRPWPTWGWRWPRYPAWCCTGSGQHSRSRPPYPGWPWRHTERLWPCRHCQPPARPCCRSAQSTSQLGKIISEDCWRGLKPYESWKKNSGVKRRETLGFWTLWLDMWSRMTGACLAQTHLWASCGRFLLMHAKQCRKASKKMSNLK